MFIKLKAFFIVWLFTISFCEKKHPPVYQKMTCDIDYALNELYYDADSEIKIRLAFHWFADTIGEINYDAIDSSVVLLNNVFEHTGISFTTESIKEQISSNKYDMPSYIKTAKFYNVKGAINIYVYDDKQENFPEDKRSVVGSSGGIPSTFLAIRKSYLTTTTIAHEVAHTLGCFHIDTYDSDTTGSSSKTGDKICDTPAAIALGESVTTNCLYTGTKNYTPEELKIITCNIMTSAYTKCRGCFTDGQIQRMKWILEQSSDLRATIKEPPIPYQ